MRTYTITFLLVAIVLGFGQKSFADCPQSSTDKKLPAISWSPVPAVGAKFVYGKLADAPPVNSAIQLCVDGKNVGSPVSINADYSFVTQPATALAGGQTIALQLQVSKDGGAIDYGGSISTKISDTYSEQRETKIIAIAGGEWSGYSSLGQSANPFVNFFIQGPATNLGKTIGVDGWGRVRLLGSPQPSTQGIVSTFVDPTGQLMTQDYSKVGTAFDFAFGPAFPIKHKSEFIGWDLLAGFGATTPLSSQAVAVTYKAPAGGSIECSTLVSRFSVKNGYAPGLTAAPSGSTSCLANGITDVSFSNQDRSSLLLKYGAGVRTTAKFSCPDSATDCTPAYGALDITIGQDESVTRGQLRHWVLKLDGVMPLAVHQTSVSYIYLFGSLYIRMERNNDLSPLILATDTVTIPSPTVIVLPLLQPDRDYYRVGIGLNLNQVFCKMFSSTCPVASTKPSE